VVLHAGDSRVGGSDQRDAGLAQRLQAGAHALAERARLAVLLEAARPAGVHRRRYPERLARREAAHDAGVEIAPEAVRARERAVLDGSRPRGSRELDPARPVTVRGDRSPVFPRLCDQRRERARLELRFRGSRALRHHATRRHHLHPICAAVDLAENDAANRGDVTRLASPEAAMAAGRGDGLTRAQEPRPGDLAAQGPVAQRDLVPRAAAEVARRGDAGAEHRAGPRAQRGLELFA
jgi:hypothetical protein